MHRHRRRYRPQSSKTLALDSRFSLSAFVDCDSEANLTGFTVLVGVQSVRALPHKAGPVLRNRQAHRQPSLKRKQLRVRYSGRPLNLDSEVELQDRGFHAAFSMADRTSEELMEANVRAN